jgi:hypothetical protein
MQLSYNIRPSFTILPPLYIWPEPLKRVILALAVIACFSTYILLAAGLLGVLVLVLELILG